MLYQQDIYDYNYRVRYSLGEGFVNSSQITHMVISKTE